MYDVLIVGCGAIGAAAAYELSRYELNVAVLERCNDVANGATKANNAILHAGYDSAPGTMEARLILEGRRASLEICKKLNVEYRELPAIVVATDDLQMKKVQALYEQGVKNGVPGISLAAKEEILAREPAISKKIVGGLIAPEAAIINPWEFAIAMAETATLNGTEMRLSTEVQAIRKESGGFVVSTNQGEYRSRFVINAAGNYSDQIDRMIGGSSFRHTYYAGEFFVFDKSQHDLVNSLIFSCSLVNGFKGTTVFPSVHGNLLAGPNFYQVNGPEDLGTDAARLAALQQHILRLIPDIDFHQTIREFCGIRPTTNLNDFIIGESPLCPGFVNLVGMKSPGLSAAPAIAAKGAEILQKCGLRLTPKKKYRDDRRQIRFRNLDDPARRRLVAERPLYGRVICRCETITEGEIVDAIRRPIVPKSLDAIKRRCNTGMGRCQGGFCGPRIQGILARELGLPLPEIVQNDKGSFILTGPTKGGRA